MSEPTSDRVPTVEEIEAALEAATPGPWCYALEPDATEPDCVKQGADPEDADVYIATFHPRSAALTRSRQNAILCANAPSWLAFLLDRVKAAEAERDAWEHRFNSAWHDMRRIVALNRAQVLIQETPEEMKP